MIAVDTNVRVYAHREELTQHARARARLVELAEGQARWAIPVLSLGDSGRFPGFQTRRL